MTYGGVLLIFALYIASLLVQKATGKPVTSTLDMVKSLSELVTENINNTIIKWWVVLRPNDKVPDFIGSQPSPVQSQFNDIKKLVEGLTISMNNLRDEVALTLSDINAKIESYHPSI